MACQLLACRRSDAGRRRRKSCFSGPFGCKLNAASTDFGGADSLSIATALHLPTRLRALPGGWAKRLRALWIVLFGLAVLTVVVSAIYAVRASFWVQPSSSNMGSTSTSRPMGNWSSGRRPGRTGHPGHGEGRRDRGPAGARRPPHRRLRRAARQARGPAVEVDPPAARRRDDASSRRRAEIDATPAD